MEAKQSQDRKRSKPWLILSAIGLFLLSKGKMILSLLKASKFGGTLITMLASIWAYALLFPVEFAVGLVFMIFIHELGHVIAAKQKGLPVSTPFFIPFIGALISMKRHPRDSVTEAYIAFGGPLLGTLGAFVVFCLGWLWQSKVLIVIANVGFFINLINLLPIHPLDGGRISAAVTRWLWLVGLIGGFIVILYLKSLLFLFIWALFAWELFQKYVLDKGRGKNLTTACEIEVPFEYLQQHGLMIPGEGHKRELNYQTYSTLDGVQHVVVIWEGLGIRRTVQLPMQGLIRKVEVIHIQHVPPEHPEQLVVSCVIHYEQYESDQYYDVPVSVRWKFGALYVGLALFLLLMLREIAKMNLSIL